MSPYMRPYTPGQVTAKDHSVICVPGLRAYEVVEPLATKIVDMVLDGKIEEARLLMVWFGADDGVPDADYGAIGAEDGIIDEDFDGEIE